MEVDEVAALRPLPDLGKGFREHFNSLTLQLESSPFFWLIYFGVEKIIINEKLYY